MGLVLQSIAPPPCYTWNRDHTCPSLLRFFYKMEAHYTIREFDVVKKLCQETELQVYVWPDTTLRELADLVQDCLMIRAPKIYLRNVNLSFRVMYPGRLGQTVGQDLGMAHVSNPGAQDNELLFNSKFQVGDPISLANFTDAVVVVED